MRVISGTLRGRRFNPPEGFNARPTTDFAKENIFNVLNNIVDYEDIDVLDLFSGTGSITYEFASRGAKSVTSVELNFKHQKFIQQTIQQFGIGDVAKSYRSDAFRYLKEVRKKFDLIFADAPYDLEGVDTIPDIVFQRELLTEDGLLIVEHSEENRFEGHPKLWQVRSYGKVNFSLFKYDVDIDNTTEGDTEDAEG
ncbi:MAG: RsmD family RNA methyltransferase [Bacteroidales bacterium]|nr:RsmD family RNA methyltransferase [Bacteroidales bacterium]